MGFDRLDVSPEVARRQQARYRAMSPAEKVMLADSLWDLVWDATIAGVRMRHPELAEQEVAREARAVLRSANVVDGPMVNVRPTGMATLLPSE